jgi:transposase
MEVVGVRTPPQNEGPFCQLFPSKNGSGGDSGVRPHPVPEAIYAYRWSDAMAKRGRPATEITLTRTERRQLERWAHRCRATALATRSQIILACAHPAGLTVRQIADQVGCNPATVSKWRQRFAERRLDGLFDEPRPGARRTISDDLIEQVVMDTLDAIPPDATRWSTRSMAERHGISRQKVSEIWRAFGLNPRGSPSNNNNAARRMGSMPSSSACASRSTVGREPDDSCSDTGRAIGSER